jgi:hypothetical protein
MKLFNNIRLKILLTAVFLLVSYLSPAQFIGFEITKRSGRTTFSFEKVNNLVIIPVMLSDRLPLNFILDTGVRTTILTDRTISDLVNISYDRAVTIAGAGHIRELNAYLASNVSLSMPGINGRGQSLIVLEEDYLELRNHLGIDVHGIIGYEFFNHFVVMIDYDRNLITVYDPEVFRPRRRHTTIPFDIDQARPYISATLTQHNGTAIDARLLLDTGASHGVLLETDTDPDIFLPDEKLKTVIGWGLGGELSGYLGRIKNLSIDKFEFKNVLVSFAEDYSTEEMSRLTGRNGSIGGDLLSRFTVTFDYNAGMLYLRKNRSFKYPFEFNLAGIDVVAIAPDYESFRIINVIKNSPAHEAGIRVGDVIVSLNGKPGSSFTLSEINTMLRTGPGSRINIVIIRADEVIRTSFKLRRLI